MKVTREQAALNRERILDVAGRLFRQRGLDGIGVADLMQEAGLTHGGFYGNFASKEDLMAIACERDLVQSLKRWHARAERAPDAPVAAITDYYLSRRHRDDPGSGCTLAALAGDAARHGEPVRHAMAQGLRPLVDFMASLLPGRSKAARRRKSLAIFAGMLGAVVLARGVDDPELSQEILDAMSVTVGTMR